MSGLAPEKFDRGPLPADIGVYDVEGGPQFQYAPLTNPNNIRLLWLEPGPWNEPISVSLFESLCKAQRDTGRSSFSFTLFSNEAKDLVELLPDRRTAARLFESSKQAIRNLDQGIKLVKYQALSYYWGPPQDKRTELIRVNESRFTIKRNLHEFLVQKRSETERRGPYWIDALCINQKDNTEKSTQVPMMGDIYANCDLCIAWLGLEDETTEIAFELLHSIEQRARRACQGLQNEDVPWYVPNSPARDFRWSLYVSPGHESVLKNLNIWQLEAEPFSLYGWDGVYEVLARDWFWRVWTLQEFVLPKTVEFWCGTQRLNETALLVFVRLAGLFDGGPDRRDIDGFDFRLRNQKIKMYGACQRRVQQDRIGVDSLPFNVSVTARHREFTDPRDKVYAMLSISSQHKRLSVDYERTVSEVYQNFAVHTMKNEPPEVVLELFSAVGLQGETVGLPSWVPDWTSTTGPPFAFQLDPTSKDLSQMIGAKPKLLYDGAGGCGGSFHISSDHTTLIEKGIEFDTIKALRTTPFWLLSRNQASQYIMQQRLNRESFYPSNQSLTDILTQTGSCDIAQIPPNFGWFRASKKGTAAQLEARGAIYSFDESRKRQLMTTNTGYMGLAPLHSQVGDTVAILVGQPFPFILRQQEDHYTMVGLSYVHGIMDGEVMKEVKTGKRQIQEFQIR